MMNEEDAEGDDDFAAQRAKLQAPGRLAELVGKAAEKSFAKYGFAEHSIISHWASIVGPQLARVSAPVRVRFPGASRRGGTLSIVVDGPAAIEIQHGAPQILERLNTFLGYPAIAALKIQQGVLPPPPPLPATLPPPDPARTAAIESAVAPVANVELRESLRRLGTAIGSAARKAEADRFRR